jgi:tetratricopeptide (TPR) repeat protein
MTELPLLRRIGLIVFAIGVVAFVLRPQLSSALLTRGDALAFWGQASDARRLYARALAFDPNNVVAADRYAFSAAISHDADLSDAGVVIATRTLQHAPHDASLLMDRALCYQHLRRYAEAIADFERSAMTSHDPRALMFAAIDERRLHGERQAHRLLLEAVALDPRFTPARRALEVQAR